MNAVEQGNGPEANSPLHHGGRSAHRLLSANDWQRHKSIIYSLYITKDLPLPEVKKRMAKDHNFKPTSRMYKSRLGHWGFVKNVSRKDWESAAILWFQRMDADKSTESFEIHGRTKSLGELRKYIKASGLSEKDFVANALASGSTVSDAVRCGTPTQSARPPSSGDSSGRPSTSSDPSLIGNLPICTPTSSRDSKRSQPQQDHVNYGYPITGDRELLAPYQKVVPSNSIMAAMMPNVPLDNSGKDLGDFPFPSSDTMHQRCHCDNVQQDFGLMLVQTYSPDALTAFPNVRDVESWQFVSAPDPAAENKICPKCQHENRNHSPLPPDWVMDPSTGLPQMMSRQNIDPTKVLPGSDEASTFQACCFAACMYGGQQRYELLAKSLQQADQMFEQMLKENNSMALISVLLTLTILHAHDQGPMAASIIRSALHVSHRILGEGNAMSLSIEWLTAAAGKTLPQCRINAGTLRAVYKAMEQTFGEYHQNTIVTLYCLSFQLILDKAFEQAESQFGRLYEICKTTLGPSHLQTISTLNGLSRSQTRQGKHEDAIKTLRHSIGSHPLGPNHPYRLETMRRLALLYKKVNKKDQMESIYWAVLKGRIKTLGKSHSFTESARLDLERILKDLGKWDEEGVMEARLQKLYGAGSEAFASDFESF